MLINILAWLFGFKTTSRRRSRNEPGLGDLVGGLLLLAVILGFWL